MTLQPPLLSTTLLPAKHSLLRCVSGYNRAYTTGTTNMGQKCCTGARRARSKLEAKTEVARATTSPLAPEPKSDMVKASRLHPHHSMAGDLITCRRARKLDIRDAAIDDYVHL